MWRKIITPIILCFSIQMISAQISVESCAIIENDLDARNYPILDDDGTACSLVKIVTTAKGFNFEIGQLPIKKVDESKIGEIWVYVPEGTMKMKITHPDLGSLRGADVENGYYMFSQRLKKAKVYRLVLTHKEVLKVVGPQVPVKLTFKCDVDGAEVIVGDGNEGKLLGTIANHQYSMTWPKGHSIAYRIKKKRYEEYEGTYKVENDANIINVNLKPLFGYVTIKTLPEATIKLNGKEVARGSYNEALDNGSYSVIVSKSGYHDAHQTFSINSGEHKEINIEPEMIYGSVKVTSNPSGAEVYVDGKRKGVTPTTIDNLVPGSHKLELRKNSYVNINQTVQVVGDQIISTTAEFTTKQSIQTLRDHAKRNHIYITAGFQAGALMASNFGLGFYMPKAAGSMVEIGGFYGFAKSNEVFWYNSDYDNIGKATYSPLGGYASIGFAIKCSLKFHVTPKVSFHYIGLKSNWTSTNGKNDPASGSNASAVSLGCMISYTICPHFMVSLTPEYSLAIKESNGFKEIAKHSPSIKNFDKGFNGKLGLTYYF